MTKRELYWELIKEMITRNEFDKFWGEKMFTLFTKHGLPPEFFFDKFKEKFGDYNFFSILMIYLGHMVDHSYKSGMKFESTSHKNMWKANNRVARQYLMTGDIY